MTPAQVLSTTVSTHASQPWEGVQSVGLGEVAAYLSDGVYGVHGGPFEDADGGVQMTWTVVHAEDGVAVPDATFETAEDAINDAESAQWAVDG